jgi:hypothetical protein
MMLHIRQSESKDKHWLINAVCLKDRVIGDARPSRRISHAGPLAEKPSGFLAGFILPEGQPDGESFRPTVYFSVFREREFYLPPEIPLKFVQKGCFVFMDGFSNKYMF